MSLVSLMIHTCNIETQSGGKSATGGFAAAAYVTRATGVACRFAKLKPDDAAIYYGKEDVDIYYRVYLNTEQTLTLKDQLLFQGNRFLVRSVNNVDALARIWEVDVQQIPD